MTDRERPPAMDSNDFESLTISAEIPTGPDMESNGTTSNGTENGGNGCYDELFPALPGGLGAAAPVVNGKAGSWGLTGSKSVPAVRAINKTEFFVIPSEERRHKDLPSSSKFGGQYRVCLFVRLFIVSKFHDKSPEGSAPVLFVRYFAGSILYG